MEDIQRLKRTSRKWDESAQKNQLIYLFLNASLTPGAIHGRVGVSTQHDGI
jgi:hypothetical protein